MNLKKNGKVFTSKFVGTGPSAYEKRIYWAAVSQRLRNTDLERSREISKQFSGFITHFCPHLFRVIRFSFRMYLTVWGSLI